ncbi:hypothetical protein [Natrinema salaciae]|uniref:Small CPxCG-related zinc finger protein n=1 Tax=Natrinema salaciae TaxID=1186196 RepID=A0A1H9QBN3_9EURY|nr:hypothetical protein [Natrinema salaciae]SER57874.1 hypothetical protein SAMN04489841_4156 [Natrinema salaciae]
MVSRITIHCDCGTDIRIAPTDDPVTCPDCETTFATTVYELPDDHDAPSTRHGTRTYRGP